MGTLDRWLEHQESVQKQVLQLNIYTKQDAEKLEQLNLKLQALPLSPAVFLDL